MMSSTAIVSGQDNTDNLSPGRIVHSNTTDTDLWENEKPCLNQDVCHIGTVQKLDGDNYPFNNENLNLQSSNNMILNQKQNTTLTLPEECSLPPECLTQSGVVGASGDGLNNLLCDGVGINIVSGGKPASVKVLNNVNGDGTDHLKSHSNHTTNIQSYAKVAQNVADIIHATDSTDKIWKETIQKDNCDEGQIDNDIYVSPEGKVSGHFGDLSLSNGDIVDPASADSMICGGKMKALKETIGHYSRFNDEIALQNSVSSNHVPNQTAYNGALVDRQIIEGVQNTSETQQDTEGMSGEFQNNPFDPPYPDGYPSEYIEANMMGAKQSNACQLRRETEKPPRMQKQRSQDRLLLLKQQQKQSFDSDTKSRESLSRESSFECLDSTGVDVHEFLVNTLRSCTRDRVILLKLEHDMISFINDKTIDFMKFPQMTSYHRMLVHRVAAYFGMDHNVDETGKSVIINKTCSTRIPEIRFSEHIDLSMVDQQPGRHDNDMRRRSILKRTNQSRSFDRDDMKGRSLWKDSRQRSIEEREEEYEKVRARIFSQGGAGFNGRGMSHMTAARMAFGERPWNSTDMDAMPSMRRPLSRPLTTRASSYSSISLLPRHNSITSNKTGSSSSVSSMPGGSNAVPTYAQNRQPQNLSMPRPTTPMRKVDRAPGIGDNDGTVYYSVPQQGQEVEYDITSPNEDIPDTWYRMSGTPEPSCPNEESIIVPNSAPILLAVPAGYMLPPETVLCHPVSGLPYVNPEGYQLVYQTGAPVAAGPPGMNSPRVAQYYKVPPNASPQPPAMAFAPGQSYGLYHQQSPQKPASVPQGSGGDYPVGRMQTHSPSQFASMPYPHNSSTAAAYTTVPQSYSYQPSPGPQAMYRQSQEQILVNQSNGAASQPNMAYQPVMFNTTGQIPQQTIVYNNQKMSQLPHQQPPGSNYPQYVFTSPPPPTAQPQKSNALQKDSGPNNHVMMNPIHGNIMQGHPMPPRPPVPQQYPSFPPQPYQVIYSPAMQHPPATPGHIETFQQPDMTKAASQTQTSLGSIDDQLSEKMNAIVLKNTQSSKSGSTNTAAVPTSASVATSQQSLAEAPNPCLTQAAVAYRPPPDQLGYSTPSPYPYGNPQQPQQHVYLLPTNNAIPSGPSYRTYSQFMTSPQTPQVMGPGVNFVYLSPPPFSGVVGMENPTTPNAQMYQNPNMQYMAAAAGSTATGTVTNSNNNNAQVLYGNVQPSYSSNPKCKDSLKEQEHSSEKQKSKYQPGESNTSPSGSSDAEFSPATKGDSDQEKTAEDVSNSQSCITPVHHATQIQGIATSQETAPTVVYYQSVTTATANGANITLRPPSNFVFQPQGQPILTHPNQPLLLGSNVQHDFRATGMSGPPSYSPGVASFYPSLSPSPGFIPPCVSPYMKCYLPATTARGQKFSEVKVFPARAATSPSPGLIAVQLPNQSQIQLVPASLSPQAQPIYYAQHSHPNADIASSHQIHTENRPEETTKYPIHVAQRQDNNVRSGDSTGTGTIMNTQEAKHSGEQSTSVENATESIGTRSD